MTNNLTINPDISSNPSAGKFTARIEQMLRVADGTAPSITPRDQLLRGAIATAGMLCYGACMGSFSLWGGDSRGWTQMLFSALKVPMLVVVTLLLSLPGFFVFYTLAGLSQAFGGVFRSIIATQSTLGLMLGALSPLLLLWHASSGNYLDGVLVSALLFGVGAVSSLVRLQRLRRGGEVSMNSRQRKLLWLWGGCYIFIGVQMGWTLRPFIGVPGAEATLFREDGWGNAWESLFSIIVAALQ